MKAPEKIFFPNDINLLTKLSLVIKQKGDVCYISKDSILSKLTERMEQAKVDAGGCSNMHASGKYIAYQEVIDLINEL